MGKNVTKFSAITIGLLASIILAITWIYPFSTFSIHKSYYYKPDPVVTNEYVKDLNNFKNTYDIRSNDNFSLTLDRTQYILQMFEQDWLIKTEVVKMDYLQLEAIEMEVKEVRTLLLELLLREEYSVDAKEQLGYTLKNVIALADLINEIQYRKDNESRNTLNTEFDNLQMSFVSTFMVFETFIERAKNDE